MKPDDSTGIQSRVIHVRALPDDVSQEEVINLCLPFKKYGQPKDYLLLKVSTKTDNFRFKPEVQHSSILFK